MVTNKESEQQKVLTDTLVYGVGIMEISEEEGMVTQRRIEPGEIINFHGQNESGQLMHENCVVCSIDEDQYFKVVSSSVEVLSGEE